MITLHGASVECLSCLKYYYTTEYKLYTLQHPCIIEESNIYQTYQDGIIRISKAPPHFGPACCYTGTPFFEPRYSNISLYRHLISERRFPSFSSNERHKTFMGSPAIRGLGGCNLSLFEGVPDERWTSSEGFTKASKEGYILCSPTIQASGGANSPSRFEGVPGLSWNPSEGSMKASKERFMEPP